MRSTLSSHPLHVSRVSGPPPLSPIAQKGQSLSSRSHKTLRGVSVSEDLLRPSVCPQRTHSLGQARVKGSV